MIPNHLTKERKLALRCQFRVTFSVTHTGFDYRDVIGDADAYGEMVSKSGQHSSPCVEIDGHMLADVGGDEVEVWMRQNGHI